MYKRQAGGEVHRYLYGRTGDVSFEDLRVPETNIRYGTTYLHILLTRYFAGVHDPRAREYCAVAVSYTHLDVYKRQE